MIITNAKYKKDLYSDINNSIEATIDGTVWVVPIAGNILDANNRLIVAGNSHYLEILKQVADGDITIAEAD